MWPRCMTLGVDSPAAVGGAQIPQSLPSLGPVSQLGSARHQMFIGIVLGGQGAADRTAVVRVGVGGRAGPVACQSKAH